MMHCKRETCSDKRLVVYLSLSAKWSGKAVGERANEAPVRALASREASDNTGQSADTGRGAGTHWSGLPDG